MNLHRIVSGAVGAVNPRVTIGIRVSVGNTVAADGTASPGYATPGAITASIGGTFTASAAGTTLTVAAVLTGSLQPGDEVSGTDGTNVIPAGITVLSQLTGPAGGAGTYQLSAAVALGSCTVTSASTTLLVSAVAGGVVQIGQALADVTAALLAGTVITEALSGAGGAGTYALNKQQTVASETMTTSLSLLAQVQPVTFRDIQQMDGLNLQGTRKAIYVNGSVDGIIRVALKGGDLVTFPDGSVWLVALVLEGFNITAGWTKAAITLQNGS